MVIVMMGINDYGDILYYKDIPENSNWIFKHCRTYRFLRILATNIWQNLSKHMVLATAQNKDKNPSEISSVHKIFSSEECLKLGLLYRSQGKSVLEEEVLRRGVEIDPANDRCAVVLGQCLRNKGEKIAATGMFNIALKLNPLNDWAYVGLGENYKDDGLIDDAERMFNKAIELNPKTIMRIIGWVRFMPAGGII